MQMADFQFCLYDHKIQFYFVRFEPFFLFWENVERCSVYRFCSLIFFFLRVIWSHNKLSYSIPCFLLILCPKYFRNILHFQFVLYLLKSTIFGSLRWILKGQRTNVRENASKIIGLFTMTKPYHSVLLLEWLLYWCVHCTCTYNPAKFFFFLS